jgi:hypothetical protein
VVGLSPEQAAHQVELRHCPKCQAPAGNPCRTASGTVAARYHTARVVAVPALRDALTVAVPSARPDQPGPGMVWTPRPTPTPPRADPIRIGYARNCPALQDLRIQLDALEAARCKLIFSETISTRTTIRPEFHNALTLAHDLKQASPTHTLILCVHELSQAARNSRELIATAAALESGGIALELLTGPLAGTYDPKDQGGSLFALLAAIAQLDRDYNRNKAAERRQATRLPSPTDS